jgi:uncharacterized protein
MAEPGEGFYPYQAPIDAYGNGGFRFAGMSHRGSLLCLPTGMHAWDVTDPPAIDAGALSLVFEAADQIEVLLIGTGAGLVWLDPQLKAALSAVHIVAEPIATGGAVRTYNILLAEKRAVAAALIAVENAR